MMSEEANSKGGPPILGTVILTSCGLGLVGCFVALSKLSQGFVYGEGHAMRPLWTFLGWMFLAFIFYAVPVWWFVRQERISSAAGMPQANRRTQWTTQLAWVLFIALAARCALLESRPIQENDYKRYLWDGAALSHGVNPYRYAPQEISSGHFNSLEVKGGMANGQETDLEKLRRILATEPEAKQTHYWINHPHVRTIYPPLAQLVFACAYKIMPWSLKVLRMLFMVFEAASVLLLLDALRRLRLSPLRILLYAWSPLAIKELVNSPHLDALVVFCLALSIWCWVTRRPRWLGAALGLGVLAKSFPVVLLPATLVAVWRRWGVKKALLLLLIFGLVVGVGYLPFLYSAGDLVWDGHKEFAQKWRQNESLFGLLAVGCEWVVSVDGLRNLVESMQAGLGSSRDQAGAGAAASLLARLLYGCAMIAVSLMVAFWPDRTLAPAEGAECPGLIGEGGAEKVPAPKPTDELRNLLDLPGRWLIVTAVLFLAAPTGNPWYGTWLLPLLCLWPVRGLVLLTGLLPIYYLTFFLEYNGSLYQALGTASTEAFVGFQLVEYLPVYLILAVDGLRHAARRFGRMKAEG